MTRIPGRRVASVVVQCDRSSLAIGTYSHEDDRGSPSEVHLDIVTGHGDEPARRLRRHHAALLRDGGAALRR